MFKFKKKEKKDETIFEKKSFFEKMKEKTDYYRFSKKMKFMYILFIAIVLILSFSHNYFAQEYKNNQIEQYNEEISKISNDYSERISKLNAKKESLKKVPNKEIKSKVREEILKYQKVSKRLGFEIKDIKVKEFETKNGQKKVVIVKYENTAIYNSSIFTSLYIMNMVAHMDGVKLLTEDYKKKVIIFTEEG